MIEYSIADLQNGAKAVVQDGIAIFVYYGDNAQSSAEKAVEELKRAYEVWL